MSRLTLDRAFTTPVTKLAQLPADALFDLKTEAADILTAAKGLIEHIDTAVELRFAEQAQTLRFAAGKDTGVVHFTDGAVRVTADLPKKIEWDQAKLAEIVSRIVAAGDNPAQYVDVSYRVAETKYCAWPTVLQEQFTPARTMKTGKPGFRLALIDGGDTQ
ncbi:hypothetical protein ACO0K3_04575 [Undibacterium sp. Rencai35W]|uniref:hypothetical protein n=1 Tax=Undibacterium sp. Rencai35W TaxID=3413046 RepID=UPI003BF27DAF